MQNFKQLCESYLSEATSSEMLFSKVFKKLSENPELLNELIKNLAGRDDDVKTLLKNSKIKKQPSTLIFAANKEFSSKEAAEKFCKGLDFVDEFTKEMYVLFSNTKDINNLFGDDITKRLEIEYIKYNIVEAKSKYKVEVVVKFIDASV